MPVRLSNFRAGRAAYLADGDDGTCYAVGYRALRVNWLAANLREFARTHEPVELKTFSGDRCAWVRDITKAEVTHG